MLVIQDEIIKIGGIVLSGQAKSIEITQEAIIDEIQDDKGKTKSSQPTGYGAARISIDFVLEDSDIPVQEQIADLQRLFRPYGQSAASLLSIVNEDCAARGINEVYFKNLSTKNIISASGRTATLELITAIPAIIETKTVSASSKKKTSGNKNTSGTKKEDSGPETDTEASNEKIAKAGKEQTATKRMEEKSPVSKGRSVNKEKMRVINRNG